MSNLRDSNSLYDRALFALYVNICIYAYASYVFEYECIPTYAHTYIHKYIHTHINTDDICIKADTHTHTHTHVHTPLV
jgi:hypothetical protein